MTNGTINAKAITDEDLDAVYGGTGNNKLGVYVGRCGKCNKSLYTTDYYMCMNIKGRTIYYCEGHEPKGAYAPAKSC
ncbi:MAG: hypothetical protein II820_10395 [Ruminiclostridium sp.]|nr:hypothetical protein [Ruminiclostridium sp.]